MLISKAGEIFAHLCSLIIHQETEEVIDDARLDYLHIAFIIIIIPARFASLENITDIDPSTLMGFLYY